MDPIIFQITDDRGTRKVVVGLRKKFDELEPVWAEFEQRLYGKCALIAMMSLVRSAAYKDCFDVKGIADHVILVLMHQSAIEENQENQRGFGN